MACAKVLTILNMAGWYNKPVQCGRKSAHKSRAQGDPSSLGDYMNANQHISKEEWRPSAGPERSRLLQILPSLTVMQLFSVSAYFSCANIGGRLSSADA